MLVLICYIIDTEDKGSDSQPETVGNESFEAPDHDTVSDGSPPVKEAHKMIILALTLTAWAILRKYAAKPRRKQITAAPIVVYDISPAEIQRREKARERAQKAEQAREIARMELDHIEAQRIQLMYLYDALEAERGADSTTQSRKNTLTRQLIGLEEKLYKLDARKAKAYNAAFAA